MRLVDNLPITASPADHGLIHVDNHRRPFPTDSLRLQ
jgi:hypothetical protein